MIRTDSRKVVPGDIFVALHGLSSDGADYIDKAVENGAELIVCEKGSSPVMTLNVSDTRKWLEEALEDEYGDIIRSMTLIGVTGTNGKTTTSFLISQTLNALGIPCAYIGTVGFFLGEKVRNLSNTSVDICDLYELLLEAHEKGFDHVALEASSQGLDMGRLNTLTFDAAVFTNLTEDHLDYHGTMEKYALAKQKLFRMLKDGGTAVVNADDGYAGYFTGVEGVCILTYGKCEGTDYRIIPSEDNKSGCLTVEHEGRVFSAPTSLVGDYNMYNLSACAAVIVSLGISCEDFFAVVPRLKTPEGRLDRISWNGCNIVIDYAHTPDAFEKVFETVRTFTNGRMIAVFGCTGDRERDKRPVMTNIALTACDYSILTVDDLHSEEPEQIFDDMLKGCEKTNYEICPDRREAIRRGIGMLSEGDSLMILGKGHEMFIAKDSGNIPHNDRQAVMEMIEKE